MESGVRPTFTDPVSSVSGRMKGNQENKVLRESSKTFKENHNEENIL